MADPLLGLPPLPQAMTPEQRRALALDPRAAALSMAGEPAMREAGTNLMQNQLGRQQLGLQSAGQQFTEALQRRQEARETAVSSKQLQQRGAELEMGRYQFVSNPANPLEFFLWDKLQQRLLPLDYRPGRKVRPGGAPAASAPSAQPPPPGTPPPGAPAAPVPGQPGAPQGEPQTQPGTPNLRMPSGAEYLESQERGKVTRGVQAELTTLDKAGPLIKQAHDAVLRTPEAFGLGSEKAGLVERLPGIGGALGPAARAFEESRRSPGEVSARSSVAAANAVMEQILGAEAPPEAKRALLVQPNDTVSNIVAKLEKAYHTASAIREQRYREYFPVTAPSPYPPLTPTRPTRSGRLAVPDQGSPSGYRYVE